MTRYILLFAAAALLTGCKGDVTETTPPEEAENNQSAESTTRQTPDQPEQTSGHHDSPKAVFVAFQQAVADEDLAAAIRCMDAETQEFIATVISLPLAFMSIDPEKEKSVKELMSKHGLSLEDDSEEFPIKTEEGRVAFITDVLEWLEENSDGTEGGLIDELAGASLSDVTIEGDTARGTITSPDNETAEMEFNRVDGKWFVHLPQPGIAESATTENALPGDFDSFDSSSPGFSGFEEEKPLPPVEGVTLEEYFSAWRVSLDVKDQPAGEQLKKLADELGLKLNVDPQFEAALQKPVSFEVTEGSRLQAIEAICRQVELTPVYTPTLLSLKPGPREFPAVFTGPFLLAVTEFDTDPKTATGSLTLQTYAARIPSVIVGQLREELGTPAELQPLTDAQGRKLTRNTVGFTLMPESSTTAFGESTSLNLKNLLRSVESITTLGGVMELSLPTKVEVVKFDELKAGIEKQAGDVTLTLQQADGGSVALEFNGTDGDRIHLYAFDNEGKQLDSFGGGSFGSDDSGQISESFQSTPHRIEARVVTQQEALEYNFQFPAIPIPNHSEMPEQLPELKFEGEAPVSVAFDSITGEPNFREVKLQVSNSSNKDAEVLFLELVYLDAQGKELETKSTQHGTDKIPAGGETEIEVMAFFMPEETKTVEVSLKRVEFADASQWKTEE